MRRLSLFLVILVLSSCSIRKSSAHLAKLSPIYEQNYYFDKPAYAELKEEEIYKELLAREYDAFGYSSQSELYLKNLRLNDFPSEDLYRKLMTIYGEDDRYNYFDKSIPEKIKDNLEKVACLIEKDRIVKSSQGVFELKSKGIYSDKVVLCGDVRFGTEPVVPFGSGFAISNDFFVTALHCINKNNIKNVLIVYGYKMIDEKNCNLKIIETDIYEPSGIEYADSNNDITVIKVKNAFKKERIVCCNKTGTVLKDEDFFVIGYPDGLPLKVATKASVIKRVSSNIHLFNSDTSKGNSGSPVFNLQSGEVEGIILGGESQDHVLNHVKLCRVPMRCPEKIGGCHGEKVASISLLLSYITNQNCIK